MASYTHALLTWSNALEVLSTWIPSFSSISRPDQLSFDSVAAIMSAMPEGMQAVEANYPLDSDLTFINGAMLSPPREVIVIPDCGMVSCRPFRLPSSDLKRFIDGFERENGVWRVGLLDGASDILFVFDTGDMLLIDHDERVWFAGT